MRYSGNGTAVATHKPVDRYEWPAYLMVNAQADAQLHSTAGSRPYRKRQGRTSKPEISTGHHPLFQRYDGAMPEDENADPVGPVHDPRAAFTELAIGCALVQPGQPIPESLMEFATAVVELCAKVGDEYENPAAQEDTVGDHIRAIYFE